MTPVSRPLPDDPLQRSVILWLKEVKNLSEMARAILAYRKTLPEDSGKRRLAVMDLRSQLSRSRSGRNPDIMLSTISEWARALKIDPVSILSFERDRELSKVADAARAKAGKKKDVR